ncbi:hypothetical protein LWI29_007284 [Acer saccharum]|uniref:MULE transposase domain-containing protein n=1 Tax=Acer saccharum TaxID=4024 RepID=A0AA39VY12_ACESA|nr:hypothetical protein LWI29_016176 [Acer saccharum]KAK0595498.1 hypothetical protein LWI29_007284 [Acer saccharum]
MVSQVVASTCRVHETKQVRFMIDRQKGIMPAFDEVWPNHKYRFCCRHKQNMLGRFKVDYLKDLFWLAVTSSNKVAFLKAIDEIKQTSPEAHAYLTGISLETQAVHAFDTICKSDHNTNNVVEAFNGWMNKHRTL